jgi:hypothetical protein
VRKLLLLDSQSPALTAKNLLSLSLICKKYVLISNNSQITADQSQIAQAVTGLMRKRTQIPSSAPLSGKGILLLLF